MTEPIVDLRPTDYGTPELHAKHRVSQIPTEDAGVFAARVEDECLLDRLFLRGHLRAPHERDEEEARRRKDAGLWLREQWHVGNLESRQSGGYQAGGARLAHLADQMSDSAAYAQRRVTRALRATAPFQIILVSLCIYDTVDRYTPMGRLRKALDLLGTFTENET